MTIMETEFKLTLPAIKSAAGGAREPSCAHVPKLHARLTPAAAMQTVVFETLRHLQTNVPGVLENEDAEFIHQARVALRRLRSAQKAFADIASGDDWQIIMPEIKWLAELLGNVRDLDVFLAETLPPIEAALASETEFVSLKKAVMRQRSQYRQALRAALSSSRYAALLLRLLKWLNESIVHSSAENQKLLRFAHRSLNKRWRQVDRLAAHWQSLDREQRHDLRKRVKKLRYTIEFFSSLYERKAVVRYLKTLEMLQGILGVMNDRVAAQILLDKLIQQHPSLAHAGGVVVGWLAGTSERSELELDTAIKQLRMADNFWSRD